MVYTDCSYRKHIYPTVVHCLRFWELWLYPTETFKVDINNTAELLKGEIGAQIRERDIIVSFLCTSYLMDYL